MKENKDINQRETKKNILENSSVHAEGDVHIGDTITIIFKSKLLTYALFIIGMIILVWFVLNVIYPSLTNRNQAHQTAITQQDSTENQSNQKILETLEEMGSEQESIKDIVDTIKANTASIKKEKTARKTPTAKKSNKILTAETVILETKSTTSGIGEISFKFINPETGFHVDKVRLDLKQLSSFGYTNSNPSTTVKPVYYDTEISATNIRIDKFIVLDLNGFHHDEKEPYAQAVIKLWLSEMKKKVKIKITPTFYDVSNREIKIPIEIISSDLNLKNDLSLDAIKTEE